MKDKNKGSLEDFFRDAYRPPREKQKHQDNERMRRYFAQGVGALFGFGYGLYSGITSNQVPDFLVNAQEAGMVAIIHPVCGILFSRKSGIEALSDSRYVFPAAFLGLYLGQYYRNSM